MLFEMKQENDYKIPFKGLKIGKHEFEYIIKKKFFTSYTYDDFLDSNVRVHIDFEKQNTIFELYFTAQGTIIVNCDVSGEEFSQPIEGKLKLIVEFGEKFNNENEQILIIPHNDYELDIAQYIYEMIVLSVPIKRIHPGVIDGTLESKAMNKLKELNKQEEKIDPRWEKLKGLIKDK